jgi:hypothetical protein
MHTYIHTYIYTGLPVRDFIIDTNPCVGLIDQGASIPGSTKTTFEPRIGQILRSSALICAHDLRQRHMHVSP